MDIIIAGDGEVGLHLAEALVRSNHNITIVDPHEELLKLVESHSDLMTITGDSTSTSVLQRANVKKADLVVAVVHDEHINLLTGILAKKMGAKKSLRVSIRWKTSIPMCGACIRIWALMVYYQLKTLLHRKLSRF